jgi:hypothetical protein
MTNGLVKQDWGTNEKMEASDFNVYAAKINDLQTQVASVPSDVNLDTINAQLTILQAAVSALVKPPSDFIIVQMGGGTSRSVGYGDFLTGFYVGRAFTAGKVIYQFDSADGSGNSVVEMRRNGVQVSGSSLSISAANQVDGSGTDAARTATVNQLFSVGDRISLYCSSMGYNPGKGLRAWVYGVWM